MFLVMLDNKKIYNTINIQSSINCITNLKQRKFNQIRQVYNNGFLILDYYPNEYQFRALFMITKYSKPSLNINEFIFKRYGVGSNVKQFDLDSLLQKTIDHCKDFDTLWKRPLNTQIKFFPRTLKLCIYSELSDNPIGFHTYIDMKELNLENYKDVIREKFNLHYNVRNYFNDNKTKINNVQQQLDTYLSKNLNTSRFNDFECILSKLPEDIDFEKEVIPGNAERLQILKNVSKTFKSDTKPKSFTFKGGFKISIFHTYYGQGLELKVLGTSVRPIMVDKAFNQYEILIKHIGGFERYCRELNKLKLKYL